MIRLTQTVQKGGCAAKVSAVELRKILGALRFPPKPSALLVDGGLFDDAAIYRVSPELALVQTLDFFTPVLDSPRAFGQVAAANALSDVYAMGGEPKTAMAILAFPLASMDSEVVVEVLQGACDLLTEAKVALVGGHSIDDESLKFGLSVTGYVHPEKVWSNAGAKVGDALILTKGLGTGSVTAALKRGALEESGMGDVLASMCQLNDAPALLGDLREYVHAATDITGFGIAGHGMQMAKASGASFAIEFQKLPVFPLAWKCLSENFLTKAHASNAAYTREFLTIECTISDSQRGILFDPQTSGGLLLSVAPEKADAVLRALKPRFPYSACIGKVEAKGAHSLVLR
jgi:selenide,water dikinase